MFAIFSISTPNVINYIINAKLMGNHINHYSIPPQLNVITKNCIILILVN
uniref:Uncharacterized protein n=1 Tax=Lepeophtheirus salmonis TaxID=72036 RepID=A0A0K2TT54_LEPSM